MKVLITYASAGAGHRRIAEAAYDYFKNNLPDLKLELVDILPFGNPILRFCYNSGYPFLVNYATWLWGLFFWMTEFKLTRWISHKSSLIVNYFSFRKFANYLMKEEFDFIISTHFLNSELVANLKLKHKIQAKLITVITDFGVHPFWVSAGTDLYIAASGLTKDALLKAGVPEDKIKAMGIPFNSSFSQAQNKKQLSDKLAINPNNFTVLVMTGSFGTGPLEKIAKILSAHVQVLVVCAKNKKLFKRLQKQNLNNVKVFGFVNNAPELMAVSDAIITKPGGSTITEVLIMELPVIFISAIPGQEIANVQILAQYGIGIRPKNIQEIKNIVLDFKNNPQKILKLKQRIREIQKPFACKELASVIR